MPLLTIEAVEYSLGPEPTEMEKGTEHLDGELSGCGAIGQVLVEQLEQLRFVGFD